MPNVKDKALTLEDLKEALVQTGNALPAISSSDEGKIMRVDSSGEWGTFLLPTYDGVVSGGGDIANADVLICDFITDTVTITYGALDKWNRRLYGG